MNPVTIAQLMDYMSNYRSRTTVMDGSDDRPYDKSNFVDLSIALDALSDPEYKPEVDFAKRGQ